MVSTTDSLKPENRTTSQDRFFENIMEFLNKDEIVVNELNKAIYEHNDINENNENQIQWPQRIFHVCVCV